MLIASTRLWHCLKKGDKEKEKKENFQDLKPVLFGPKKNNASSAQLILDCASLWGCGRHNDFLGQQWRATVSHHNFNLTPQTALLYRQHPSDILSVTHLQLEVPNLF
jgi:hypothetical protein